MSKAATVLIDYTNWRGERRMRRVVPTGEMRLETSEWHPTEQWVMRAIDCEDGKVKHFAMSGIHAWGVQAGYVVVPIVPTNKMVEAGASADWVGAVESREGQSIVPDEDCNGEKRPGIWAAMIEAAQEDTAS